MNEVTPNAFNFAQQCALDGVLPQKNVIYLAHYVQVLMDEYDARIAEMERQHERDDRAIRRYRIIITGQGDHIAELERQQHNRAIMPAPGLNAEPDGDVVWA